MTQTSQVAGDVLWPKLVFSCSILLQDNVYVKTVSVADTEPRITWQKPLVTLCSCSGVGTDEGDDFMFAGVQWQLQSSVQGNGGSRDDSALAPDI